ncbi:hypothetical protein IFM89_000533 [Coptis chinensis]|uniref:Uncharacterized protein n=1 Tax=Coptis chinensis TaxID=261450 RepID=A0A835H3N5_9MAGN|nr:hypothetical protein IFM89_000533 [Coptis chinensis]
MGIFCRPVTDPYEEEKKSISKIKRIGQIATVQKQAKSLKPPERSSSNTNSLRLGTSSAVSNVQVSSANQVSLPTRLRSRRKKALMRFELKSPENIGNELQSWCLLLYFTGSIGFGIETYE